MKINQVYKIDTPTIDLTTSEGQNKALIWTLQNADGVVSLRDLHKSTSISRPQSIINRLNALCIMGIVKKVQNGWVWVHDQSKWHLATEKQRQAINALKSLLDKFESQLSQSFYVRYILELDEMQKQLDLMVEIMETNQIKELFDA